MTSWEEYANNTADKERQMAHQFLDKMTTWAEQKGMTQVNVMNALTYMHQLLHLTVTNSILSYAHAQKLAEQQKTNVIPVILSDMDENFNAMFKKDENNG